MSSQSEIFSRYRSLVVSNTQKPYISDAQKKLDKLEFIDFLVELVKSTRGQKEFKSLILVIIKCLSYDDVIVKITNFLKK